MNRKKAVELCHEDTIQDVETNEIIFQYAKKGWDYYMREGDGMWPDSSHAWIEVWYRVPSGIPPVFGEPDDYVVR